MRAIYVDAGSGALRPVPADVIRACREAVPGLPLFVGGGIQHPEQARAARAAGADFVVIGTAVETAESGKAEGASVRDELTAFVRAVGGPGIAP